MSKRTVPFRQTIENAEKFLKSRNETWNLSTFNVDDLDLFWVGEIKFTGLSNRAYPMQGKGRTKDEMLASTYGEAVERYTLHSYIQDYSRKKTESVPEFVYNLYNGDKVRIHDTFNYDEFVKDTALTCTGNTIEECILHGLYETFEHAMIGTSVYQTETCIVDTHELFPDWPDYMHDAFVFLVTKVNDIPLYYCQSIKYPINDFEKNYIGYNSKLEWVDNTIRRIPERGNLAMPTTAVRVGRDVKECIPLAMTENFQSIVSLKMDPNNPLKEIDFELPREVKKKKQDIYPIVNNITSFEDKGIKEEIIELLSVMKQYSTFIGFVDLTLPDSDLKVIKILSDFNLKPNYQELRFQRQLFEI